MLGMLGTRAQQGPEHATPHTAASLTHACAGVSAAGVLAGPGPPGARSLAATRQTLSWPLEPLSLGGGGGAPELGQLAQVDEGVLIGQARLPGKELHHTSAQKVDVPRAGCCDKLGVAHKGTVHSLRTLRPVGRSRCEQASDCRCLWTARSWPWQRRSIHW